MIFLFDREQQPKRRLFLASPTRKLGRSKRIYRALSEKGEAMKVTYVLVYSWLYERDIESLRKRARKRKMNWQGAVEHDHGYYWIVFANGPHVDFHSSNIPRFPPLSQEINLNETYVIFFLISISLI